MEQLQNQLFSAMLKSGALRFGDFTLKSGRRSPYFFNSGDLLAQGDNLSLLADAFADRVVELAQAGKCDHLFGPAYKGIALAAATAAALSHKHKLNLPWGYNRKETKAHGEGGQLVGAPPSGKVVLLDDVLTSGMAVRQAFELLNQTDAQPCALLLLLDREEPGPGGKRASAELAAAFGIEVHALASLGQLIRWLENQPGMEQPAATLRSHAQTTAQASDGA